MRKIQITKNNTALLLTLCVNYAINNPMKATSGFKNFNKMIIFAIFFVLLQVSGSAAFAHFTDLASSAWAILSPQENACSDFYHFIHEHKLSEEALLASIKQTEKEVQGIIDHRVAQIIELKKTYHQQLSFHDHPAMLRDENGQNSINITNAILLQYAPKIIKSNQLELLKISDTMIERWKADLNKLALQRNTKEYRQKLLPLVIEPEHFSALSYSLPDDGAGLALFPHALNEAGQPYFPSIAELVRNPEFYSQLSEKTKKLIQDRMRLQKPFYLSDAIFLETQLEQDAVIAIGKKLQNEVKKLAGEVIGRFGEENAETAAANEPTGTAREMRSWDAYLKIDPHALAQEWFQEIPSLFVNTVHELRSKFPLGDFETTDRTLSEHLEKYAKWFEPKEGKQSTEWFHQQFMDHYFSKDGLALTLTLPKKLFVYYDVKMATMFLMNDSELVSENFDGVFTSLQHGSGTYVSSHKSFQDMIQDLLSYGFKGLAYDLPFGGAGLKIRDLKSNIAYINAVQQRLRRKANESVVYGKHVELPVWYGGRSMGSQDGFMHALLYGGMNNPVDAYWLVSPCNPWTIDTQVKNVYQALAARQYVGVVKESLESAVKISKETRELLEKMKAENPHAFDDFGNDLFIFQGDGDVDGGPDVMERLYEWRDRFAPLAHIFSFKMPEDQRVYFDEMMKTGKNELEVEHKGRKIKVTMDMLEAGHVLHSTRPDNEVGAVKTQKEQAIAFKYAAMDYIADGPGEGREWPNARMRESQRRFKTEQELKGGKLFDWFMKTELKIDPVEVYKIKNPIQNNRDILQRMAWVYQEVMIHERNRVNAIYKNLGKF